MLRTSLLYGTRPVITLMDNGLLLKKKKKKTFWDKNQAPGDRSTHAHTPAGAARFGRAHGELLQTR